MPEVKKKKNWWEWYLENLDKFPWMKEVPPEWEIKTPEDLKKYLPSYAKMVGGVPVRTPTPFPSWQMTPYTPTEKSPVEEEKETDEMRLARESFELENELLRLQIEQMKKPSAGELQLGAERQRQESTRLQDLLMPKWGKQQLSQGELSKIYEQARSDILSTLNDPRSWIQRWEVENTPNPYQPANPMVEAAQELQRVQSEMEHWGDVLKAAPSLGGRAGEEATLVAQAGMEAAGKNAAKWQAELSQYLGMSPSGQGVERPTTPPAPSWLSQFVPQQIAGQPMQKIPLAFPSGQAWGKTPYSQREGVAGYADWMGQGWADILDRMAMAQTRTPAKTTAWKPARQVI